MLLRHRREDEPGDAAGLLGDEAEAFRDVLAQVRPRVFPLLVEEWRTADLVLERVVERLQRRFVALSRRADGCGGR